MSSSTSCLMRLCFVHNPVSTTKLACLLWFVNVFVIVSWQNGRVRVKPTEWPKIGVGFEGFCDDMVYSILVRKIIYIVFYHVPLMAILSRRRTPVRRDGHAMVARSPRGRRLQGAREQTAEKEPDEILQGL